MTSLLRLTVLVVLIVLDLVVLATLGYALAVENYGAYLAFGGAACCLALVTLWVAPLVFVRRRNS